MLPGIACAALLRPSSLAFSNTKSLAGGAGKSLVRDQGAGGSRRKMTFSFWARTNSLLVTDLLTAAGSDTIFSFVAAGPRVSLNNNSSGYVGTTGVSFAINTWYHILVHIDTANATAASRCKIFVDGVDRSNVGAAIVQDYDTQWGNTVRGTVHAQTAGANTVLIDELAKIDNDLLAATDFAFGGAPIDLSGLSFGNQGYWLRFSSFADIGVDSSGRGNGFTNSGFVSGDISSTVP